MLVDELLRALDYIEEHMTGDMKVQDVADNGFVSLSSLQKTFKYAFNISINEYIIRRKFTCAARDLLDTDDSVIDIAFKYGYTTAESFTRGFKKVWDITPGEFRKTRKFSGHTPKLSFPYDCIKKEDRLMVGNKYDLTELYDVLQERKDNAYVCADLERLMWINNNLGRKAGDEALLELMRRVESACGEDDIFMRIGGDEFVVITNSEDIAYANEIVAKVMAKNGEKVSVDGVEFEVRVHIGAFQSFRSKSANVVSIINEINRDIDIVKYGE